MLWSLLLPLVFTAVGATEIIESRANSADTWVDCGEPTWKTTLDIFVKTTGSDPGSTCEIRGYATLGSQSVNIKRDDLKTNSNFGDYLGTKVATVVTETVGHFERKFHVKLLEEGSVFQADRVFWDSDWDTSAWNADEDPNYGGWPCLTVGGNSYQGYRGNAMYCIEKTGNTCRCKGDQKLCGV